MKRADRKTYTRRKSVFDKDYFNEEIFFSIFRPTETFEKKRKRFQFIHYSFKANLFIPFLKLAEFLLKKYLVWKRKDIPLEIYNKNFHLLWDSFEAAEKEWWFTFKGIDKMPYELKQNHINDWDEKECTHFYRFPKFMLRLWLTICLEDTAYRELTNFFLFKLQGNMNKGWNPEKQHQFPLYVSGYDTYIPYFMEHIKQNLKPGEEKEITIKIKNQDEVKPNGKEEQSGTSNPEQTRNQEHNKKEKPRRKKKIRNRRSKSK